MDFSRPQEFPVVSVVSLAVLHGPAISNVNYLHRGSLGRKCGTTVAFACTTDAVALCSEPWDAALLGVQVKMRRFAATKLYKSQSFKDG
jgi:hypothetical protein